jgi:hypothetical protein
MIPFLSILNRFVADGFLPRRLRRLEIYLTTRRVFRQIGFFIGVTISVTLYAAENKERRALVVVGVGGTEEYREQFVENARKWNESLHRAGFLVTTVGLEPKELEGAGEANDQGKILDWIGHETQAESVENWLIFLGHGTYQQKNANLNLVGPDLSSEMLAGAVKGKRGTWRFVLCASSSSPFLSALSGPDRIVITATKSGSEQNFSRFGNHLADSFVSLDADLDHDGGSSLLEAFLNASDKLARWYEAENRLASEQALLDDNGDGRGTPAAFFRGVRAVKASAEGFKPDGLMANRCYIVPPKQPAWWTEALESQTVALESEIEELRRKKSTIDAADYRSQLKSRLIELAKLSEPKAP